MVERVGPNAETNRKKDKVLALSLKKEGFAGREGIK